MSFRDLRWRTDGFRVVGTNPDHPSITVALSVPGMLAAERRALAVDLADALNQHGLSQTDMRVFNGLREFIADHGHAPSLRDLADPLDVSPVTVGSAMTRLAEAGLITREPGKARAIAIVDPVAGGAMS